MALSQQTIAAAIGAIDHIAAAADAQDVTAITDHCDAVADLWVKDSKLLDCIDDLVTIDKASGVDGCLILSNARSCKVWR